MPTTLTLALASCLVAAGLVSGVVVDQTTCQEGYGWMKNAKDQSPCLVSAYLQATCQSGDWTMKPLPKGVVYSAPDAAELTACACSQAAYNAISACSACQGGDWYSWPAYSTHCPQSLLTMNGGWPASVKVPVEIVIPPFALTDTTKWSGGKFNVTEALAVAIGQSTTGTGNPTPTPTSTQPSDNNSGSSPTPIGAIVGGVVGGVVGLFILAVVGFLLFCRHKAPEGIKQRISQHLSRPPHTQLPSEASAAASPYPLMQQFHRTPSLEAALNGSAIPPISPFTPPPSTPIPGNGRSRSQDTTNTSSASILGRGLLTRITSNNNNYNNANPRPSHTARSQSYDTTVSSINNSRPGTGYNDTSAVLDIAAIRARAHPNNTHPDQIDPFMLPPRSDFIPPRGDIKGGRDLSSPQLQYAPSTVTAPEDRLRRGVADAINDPSVTWGSSSLGHGSSQQQSSGYAPVHPYEYNSIGRRPSAETFSTQLGGATDLGRYNSQMSSNGGYISPLLGQGRLSPTSGGGGGPPTAYRSMSPGTAAGPGDYFPAGIGYSNLTPYDSHHEHAVPNEPAPGYVPSQHSTPPPEKSARSSATAADPTDAPIRTSSDKKEKTPLPFLNPAPPNQRPPTWTDPYSLSPLTEGRSHGLVINDDGEEKPEQGGGRGPYMRQTLGAVSDESLIARLASAGGAGGEGLSPVVPSPIARVDVGAGVVRGQPEM